MADGRSLHVGLDGVDPDRYEGWRGELIQSEADAERMRAIALAEGFEPQSLRGSAATLANVSAALIGLAGQLVAGDLALVTYSGHGGRVPDLDRDEVDDQWDETWCLFDGQLVDDELRALYAQFCPGVRVLVISDSCHSGSVTRAAPVVDRAPAGTRYRTMPRDVELRVHRARRSTYADRQARLAALGAPKEVTATVRLLAACQDDELALEDESAGGLLTSHICTIWDSGFAGNYDAFAAEIARRLHPFQRPNHLVYGAPNPAFDDERPFKI